MALRFLSAEKRAILDSPQSGVVSAGAGSGKTTLLARAVYEDVVVRGIPVDEILVVAFNNAAAAHLVARIQDEFVLGRDPAEPAVDLSCAWVGTFHALCGRIVRERAHAAEVAPDFVVLDELESRMLLELALDEAGETCEHPGVVPMLAAFSDARVAARSVLNRGRAAGERVPVVPVPPMPAFDPGAAATGGAGRDRDAGDDPHYAFRSRQPRWRRPTLEDYNGVAKLDPRVLGGGEGCL